MSESRKPNKLVLEEISPGVKIAGLCLFFQKEKTIVFSDTQLGYEEMLNRQGIFMPRFNLKEITAHLKKVFSELCPERVIINGDLKHEFGIISEQEWNEVISFLRFIGEENREIVIVKGNHDTVLGPLAKWENLCVVEEFFLGKTLFVHGHKLPKPSSAKKAERFVIGHEHPAIPLFDGVSSEIYKCFLKGEFRGKELIVLPSLNFVALGSDILKEKHLSPFLKGSLDNFSAWLIEDKPYFFEIGGGG